MQTRALAIAVVVALFLAAACGGREDDPENAATATQPTAPTPRERVGLTLADDGSTVVVGLDTQVSLILGERYRWSTPEATGVPVDVQEVVSDAPIGAQTWELELSEAGTARIETTGSPACRPTTPGCPAADRRYVVTLDIRR